MRIISASLLIGLSFGLAACTEPGETTEIGAATGGVLGAGLGAIVGSQTGSAGTGLVIGALAGAGAGGAVGNALEAQEKTIRTQDEAIERHERTITAQRAEIDELRRLNQEPIANALQAPQNLPTNFAPHASLGRAMPVDATPSRMAAPAMNDERAASAATTASAPGTVREATLVDHSAEYQMQRQVESNLARSNLALNAPERPLAVTPPRGMGEAPASNAAVGSTLGALAPRAQTAKVANFNTPECVQAEGEVSKASGSAELADKLFHYRRALRLCPENPAYHNGLGEIYISLNRRTDAEFEFREALNLNPNFESAQNNLNSLK